ncbi:MAG TPA: sensor domain-containing diguanylate cyclase [Ancylobacter sp.]
MNLETPAETADKPHKPAVPFVGRVLVAVSILASLLMMAIIGSALWMGHQDAQAKAQRESTNLLQVSLAEIESYLQLCKFALDLAAQSLNHLGHTSLSEKATMHLPASVLTHVPSIGSLVVLDRDGNIVADTVAGPARMENLADHDYFRVPKNGHGNGVYISGEVEDDDHHDGAVIALSRRLTDGEGEFLGVVVLTIKLTHFQSLFARLNLGPKGVITLRNTNGTVLMRYPSLNDKGDIGLVLSASPIFKRMNAEGKGSFTAYASTDGEKRLYTFSRIADEPLFLTIGLSENEIFASWWQRALITGIITTLICTAIVSLAIMLRQELIRRAIAEADLAFLAVTDGLTGLANRRRFDEVIRLELQRTGRTGKSLALLMIDTDRFKEFNDTFGHARGDQVLKLLARIIEAAASRPNDLGARYGGEEFAVLLPETEAVGAMEVAETIRKDFYNASARLVPESNAPCTVSIGVKCTGPGDNLTSEEFIASTDAALYRAKRDGRNQSTLAD